jgi:hypothetical protein
VNHLRINGKDGVAGFLVESLLAAAVDLGRVVQATRRCVFRAYACSWSGNRCSQ